MDYSSILWQCCFLGQVCRFRVIARRCRAGTLLSGWRGTFEIILTFLGSTSTSHWLAHLLVFSFSFHSNSQYYSNWKWTVTRWRRQQFNFDPEDFFENYIALSAPRTGLLYSYWLLSINFCYFILFWISLLFFNATMFLCYYLIF